MRVIATQDAPSAIGPYSQAVEQGSTLFLSGQIPLDPRTGEIVPCDVVAQATRVFDNLGAVLRAAGYDYGDVVRTTIFLTDLSHFEAVNAVYGKYFRAPFPARSTVQVSALPRGGRIEVDAVAMK